MTTPLTTMSVEEWSREVRDRVDQGQRLAGLYGSDDSTAHQHDQEPPARACQVTALLASDHAVEAVSTLLRAEPDGSLRYPSLTPTVPAAVWYERALHDLSGVVPEGHPRLDPLLLDRHDVSPVPAPGAAAETKLDVPMVNERQGPVELAGRGMFTLPLGPVRSGVYESIEFLIETPGEDIPYLHTRPHYKHRGIAKQFEGRTPDVGVLVAERVEGISSVAHALAYVHALEELADLTPPSDAALVRVVLAELERMANHLDTVMRLADAAGLAVATSRFGWHKETVQRLLSGLCGSRFGRGTIGIGGLGRPITVDGAALATSVEDLDARIHSDISGLEVSASFMDRLRGTGPLTATRAQQHGAVGPIGRGSAVDNDVRRERPYDAYPALSPVPPPSQTSGDVLARTRVRWHELATSAALIVAAARDLGTRDVLPSSPPPIPDGFAVGSAEASQGEVVHAVSISAGIIQRCFARSPSLHNMALFREVFAGDVFTDLPFIEASFGLGYAGVAM